MKKTRDICITALFCLFLGGTLLLFFLLPGQDFSEKEKRYLAPAPALTVKTLLSGDFGAQAESWAADHLPGRDFLVGLNAEYERLSGRQVTKEILRGRSGRLYEAPAPFDAALIQKNMEAVRDFAALAGQPVDLMLIPSAGALLPEDMPPLCDPWPDGQVIAEAASLCGDSVHLLDLTPLFAENDPASLYYRTDHHWTSRGACLAARAYAETKGRSAPAESDYSVTAVPGFYGTTYSRSALWQTPPEALELWDSGSAFTVENQDRPGEHAGLFYREHLEEADKYPVFLDGNHSLVRIRRADGGGAGRLLVIRDSFSNCLGCFLAEQYSELVLVDLRYYQRPVSALLAEGFDDILVAYGLRNFMTDSNLVLLE